MLNAKATFDNAQNQVDLVKQQIVNASIIAPISGIISAHKVREGEFVNPGVSIATVSNVFTLKATVYVSQETGYKLELGQVATITSPVFYAYTYDGIALCEAGTSNQ